MSDQTDAASNPGSSWWWLPIFVVATLIAAWRFLPWATSSLFGDDLGFYIAFLDGRCATRAHEILTMTCSERFRPVASATVLALMNVFGDDKHLFIAINVALQGAIATLTFAIAFRLSRRSWLVSLAIASAVALSRFAVWNVVQLIGPVESIPLLMTLGTVYCAIRAEQSQLRTWSWCQFALIFALLALFSHERYLVVPVWLGVFFIMSATVRQLPARRVMLLIACCVSEPLFYIFYKKFVLHTYFLIGTGDTHLKFNLSLIIQHAYGAVCSIFGFNHGPSFLLGVNVVPGWNELFLLALLFTLLIVASWLYAVRRALSHNSSVKTALERLRWPILLLALATLLVFPALLTIRLEIRWLYASFVMVALVGAWAVSVVPTKVRNRFVALIIMVCATSIVLDTVVMKSFGDLFFVYSGRFADLVKRDILQRYPAQTGGIALLAEDDECNFTLLDGAFFRVYEGKTRELRCFRSVDAAVDAKLPSSTHLYSETSRPQLVDITPVLVESERRTVQERLVFNFVKSFSDGHINDLAKVDTPTGRGALVMPWNTAGGARETLTVISGFSYRYDDVPVTANAQLRFAAGMVFPSAQSARAIVRVSRDGGKPVELYSGDLNPPKAGEDPHFDSVSIPLTDYAGQHVSVSFSVESPGGDSSGHWVAFADPRVVEIRK